MIASLSNLAGPELLIILALCSFWAWMLIDCATKEPERTKVVWLLVVLLVPFGSLAYLFARKIGRSN